MKINRKNKLDSSMSIRVDKETYLKLREIRLYFQNKLSRKAIAIEIILKKVVDIFHAMLLRKGKIPNLKRKAG